MTMTKDRILDSFLAHQLREGLALSRASGLVEIIPADDELPSRYLARFHCKGLVKRGSTVEVASRFEVGIRFPPRRRRHRVPAGATTDRRIASARGKFFLVPPGCLTDLRARFSGFFPGSLDVRNRIYHLLAAHP